MKILLIGSGGREHALAWKLAQSSNVDEILAVPGNPGIALLDKCSCIDLDVEDYDKAADFAAANKIDLTVVGPEAPLVGGMADVFRARGLAVFGPRRAAAQLEGSKAFSKKLMEKYNIPTAFFKIFSDAETAKEFIKEKGAPIVIKADGLAAGKGVVVAMTEAEALAAVDEMMCDHKFGSAGTRVVIEEFMEGEEASLLAFSDGKTVIPMVPSQDHKRIYDDDKGPNTGGMGTYAPAPVMTDALVAKAVKVVLDPVIKAMQAEGTPYEGCLYAGLMIKGEDVKVVEFNCRFGDPETQVVLPLLEGDLAEIMMACAAGKLDEVAIDWKDKAAVCVVLASGGYPEAYAKGLEIDGIAAAEENEAVVVFHAGTALNNGRTVTAGGRVLGVTAVGTGIREARDSAYEAVGKISFAKKYFRKDIAWRALKR